MAATEGGAPSSTASLVKYDVPVLVATGKSSGAAIPGTTETQDMLNSILPPR